MGKNKNGAINADRKTSDSLSASRYLHHNLRRDEYRELKRNLTISKDDGIRFAKPNSALPIDDMIEIMLSVDNNLRPRIDLDNFRNKYDTCPYAKARHGIYWSVKGADLAVQYSDMEYVKYLRSQKILQITSELKRLAEDLCDEYKFLDLEPYIPMPLPDHLDMDLGSESAAFIKIKETIDSFDVLKNSARAIIATKENEYRGGGRPKHVWERNFAYLIALTWRSLTGEDMKDNKGIGRLKDFTSAAFNTIYKSFETNKGDTAYKDFRFMTPQKDWTAFARSAREAVAASDEHERGLWELDPNRADKLNRIGTRHDGSPIYASKITVRSAVREQ